MIRLVTIAKDEAAVIGRCLSSAAALVDDILVVDTGSSDDTVEVARSHGATVVERPWVSFGHNLTEALELGNDADWLLRLDADMTVEHHPGMKAWLNTDGDPDCHAWNVEVNDSGLLYRLPLLVRGGMEWRYVGATHEYLDATERKLRSLTGMTVHHHGDGSNRKDKFERDLALLADGYEHDDPRAVFYTAECYRFLGRVDDAITAYRKRTALNGFEEERWYAGFQAARLSADVEGLIDVHRQRPWRPEPLAAAARIVGEREHDDILFLERT